MLQEKGQTTYVCPGVPGHPSLPPEIRPPMYKMPRRVDGLIWSIRLTMTLTEEEEALFRIPNTVCVYHAKGKNGQKPHYHLYYKCDTTQANVKEYVLQNEIVKKYYKPTNGFWEVASKEHYTLELYWEYVWKNHPDRGQRFVWWDILETQLEIPEPLPILATPNDVFLSVYEEAPKAPKRSSLEKQQRFLKYAKEQYETTQKPVTTRRTLKYLYEYCRENGFTTETACFVYVNYANSHLLQGDEYKRSRAQFCERLENKFF